MEREGERNQVANEDRILYCESRVLFSHSIQKVMIAGN